MWASMFGSVMASPDSNGPEAAGLTSTMNLGGVNIGQNNNEIIMIAVLAVGVLLLIKK